ncbi:hypothetical protein [Micromonospora sp. NPDC023633]|uniref:hypothetical protein n=1 Tax=Micromonospora sp. NPDC023633 TaxID=3154320 RepID=UPI0033D38702
MKGSQVCTILFGSLPFSAVWEVAIHAAVDGQPPSDLVVAGALPQAVALALLAALAAKPDEEEQPADVPVPAPRRQVAAPARRELAR